ncbi:CsxC family protein [Bacillus sp. REN10]|uniref:CsxC family protein n=1 Tax=Bacillus sp. REN10 TaxID=2782541 RepID=UPI00193C36A5|nr:hypothetical protein [Bacillus sp. REN10]
MGKKHYDYYDDYDHHKKEEKTSDCHKNKHHHHEHQKHEQKEIQCEFVKAETLSECKSYPVCPDAAYGPFIAKLPVVLAEVFVQIPVEAEVPMPKFVYEIKRIKKNIHITQCEVVPLPSMKHHDKCHQHHDKRHHHDEEMVKLFLEGFVEKNIEYVEDCSGPVYHHTVKVPFRCFTEIEVEDLKPFKKSFKSGFEYKFIAKNNHEADREKHFQTSSEFFNEKPFCEIVDADISEFDFLENDYKSYKSKITEKMAIHLTVKVLQVQQRWINKHKHDHKCDCNHD